MKHQQIQIEKIFKSASYQVKHEQNLQFDNQKNIQTLKVDLGKVWSEIVALKLQNSKLKKQLSDESAKVNTGLKSTKDDLRNFQKKEQILKNDFASLSKSVQKNIKVTEQNTANIQQMQTKIKNNEQKFQEVQAQVKNLEENENKKSTIENSKLQLLENKLGDQEAKMQELSNEQGELRKGLEKVGNEVA